MARYKPEQVVYLKMTGEKTIIKKIVYNHQKKMAKYVLCNGLRVNHDDLTDIEPAKEGEEKTKLKYTKKDVSKKNND